MEALDLGFPSSVRCCSLPRPAASHSLQVSFLVLAENAGRLGRHDGEARQSSLKFLMHRTGETLEAYTQAY